jgi:hypothetical protein
MLTRAERRARVEQGFELVRVDALTWNFDVEAHAITLGHDLHVHRGRFRDAHGVPDEGRQCARHAHPVHAQ